MQASVTIVADFTAEVTANWKRQPARCASRRRIASSNTLAKGGALPMTGWSVAAPSGASAPLRAWDTRFSVWLVEP